MHHSLKLRLIIVNLFVFLIPMILVITLFFRNAIRQNQTEIKNFFHYNVEAIASSFSKSINSTMQDSIDLIGDETIRTYLSHVNVETLSDYHVPNMRTSTATVLSAISSRDKYIKTIGLFPINAMSINRGMTRRMFMSQEEKELAQSLNGGFFWETEYNHLYFCRMIKDIYDPDVILGYQKIELDTDVIQKEFQLNSSVEMQLLLVDQEGNILLSMQDNTENDLIKNDRFLIPLDHKSSSKVQTISSSYKKAEILSVYNRKSHTYVIGILPEKNIFFYSQSLWILALGTFLCSILCCLVLILYTDYTVFRPVLKLSNLMGCIEKEDYTVRFPITQKDEISDLADRFNIMSEKLELLYKKIYLSELRIKEAEYEELQTELNPHFLFNTLNTIQWMMELKQNGEAQQMICDLSDLYKISLYKTKDGLFPLSMELEHARSYMQIQKMRLKNNLCYSIEIDSHLTPEEIQVPKLILQPLLENAVIHGLSPNEKGEIIAAIYKDHDFLIYNIYDNGVGVDIDAMQELLHTEHLNSSHGRCLNNIQKRIHLKYGDHYGISFIQPNDGGTIVQVLLPIDKGGIL